MNRRIISLLFIIIFFACKNKTSQQNIIPFNKLKVVLWDMITAEQLAKSKYNAVAFKTKPIYLRDTSTAYYQQVLAIHHVDKKTFYNSLAYYESHPVEFSVLLDSVAAYGQVKRGDLYKKKK